MKNDRKAAMNTRTFLKLGGAWLGTAGLITQLIAPLECCYGAAATAADPFVDVSKQAYEQAGKLMLEFGRKQIENLPDANKNPRENAFGIMAMIGLGGTVGGLSMPVTGAALGGGIGVALDVCVAGTDIGAGTVGGLMIGAGAGTAAGTGTFVGSLLLCVPILLYVEEHYPYEKYQNGTSAGQPAASSRSGAQNLLAGFSASQETYFVNLVCSMPEQIEDLVEKWDRMPGLNAGQKQWLSKVDFIRGDLRKLLWIKKNRRASQSSPIVRDLRTEVERVIEAFNDKAEDAWLSALGLGSVEVGLKGGRLRVETPPSLRQFGLPAQVSSPVDDFNLRVGGAGGLLDPWVRVHFQPGPFEIQWGQVSVVKSGAEKGLVRVAYDIKPNSRVGKAEFQYKWNGPVKEIFEFEPKMGSGFKGSLYFRLDGLALQFVKARVDGFDLKVRLPRDLDQAADQLKDAVEKLARDFAKGVEKSFGNGLPWDAAFDLQGKFAVKGLECHLKLDAHLYGLAEIERVEKVAVENGKMVAHVKGKAIRPPAAILAQDEFKRRWETFAQSRQVPVAAPLFVRNTRPVGSAN